MELCIIGVYLTFNNNTRKNLLEFQAQLILVKQLSEDNPNSIIIGDFNTDLSKSNNYSKHLKQFIADTKVIRASIPTETDIFTFHNGNKKSYIDHAFINGYIMQDKSNNFNLTVFNDVDNYSDHLLISLKIILSEKALSKPTSIPDLVKPNIKFNWKNQK